MLVVLQLEISQSSITSLARLPESSKVACHWNIKNLTRIIYCMSLNPHTCIHVSTSRLTVNLTMHSLYKSELFSFWRASQSEHFNGFHGRASQLATATSYLSMTPKMAHRVFDYKVFPLRSNSVHGALNDSRSFKWHPCCRLFLVISKFTAIQWQFQSYLHTQEPT
jgi:hypothetical protein